MNLPDIIVSRRDLSQLDALLGQTMLDRIGKVGGYLLDEITRARIVDDHEIPPTLVTMGATVRFRDENSGHVNVSQLVYPREVSLQGRISVLTPVGAALLGLSEGQSVAYETIDGRLKTLTVLKVLGAPLNNHSSPVRGTREGTRAAADRATRPTPAA